MAAPAAKRAGRPEGAPGFGRTQKLTPTKFVYKHPQVCTGCLRPFTANDPAQAWTAWDTLELRALSEDDTSAHQLGAYLEVTRYYLMQCQCICGHITQAQAQRADDDKAQWAGVHIGEQRLLGPRLAATDLKSELFTYDIDERALKHAKMMDGKLLLVTNAPDFTPEEVIKRYKSLADIDRGFRVLKSEIEIGPIYHRLPDRIHAHASICFMALILYRVMRSRLKDSHSQISPELALDKLRRIQHQVVKVNDLDPIAALSNINQEHTAILQALTIKKPTLPTQLTLL